MAAETADALLRDGRAALARADWERARDSLEQAAQVDDRAEVLDLLSQAVHFLGEYGRAIELKERAFAQYQREGRRAQAADVARWLAFLHACVHGNYAVASGWMGRAASLLDGQQECAAHGWLTLDRAPFSRSAEEREQLATAAIAIARRFGDADLEFNALALLGESRVAAGRVAEGMRLLDEAMTAVCGGEVARHGCVGMICCRLLSACEHAADVRRAEQWMTVVERLAAWSSFVSPTCRCHYGGILIAIGRWPEAEAELLAAIRAFETSYRAERLFPLVRLAELRVRQGRLEEAERLLEDGEWHPTARRALARVAFARGDLALAEERVRLCLEGDDAPGCAPALELLAAIQLRRGDRPAAGTTAQRLAALAAASEDERAGGLARLAGGRVLAAQGDARATAELQAALQRFAELDLPHEAARAQLELARALAPGATAAAAGEARLALASFERLGATADADAAAALLRELGSGGRSRPRRHGPLTARETDVLALLGEGCSNAQIAERLVISRRTAEHHVASILSKLGLGSRAAAAAHAARRPPQDP